MDVADYAFPVDDDDGRCNALNRLVTLPILSTTWAYVSPALLTLLDGGGGISYVDAHHPDSLGIILVVDGLKHRLCDLAGGTRDAKTPAWA